MATTSKTVSAWLKPKQLHSALFTPFTPFSPRTPSLHSFPVAPLVLGLLSFPAVPPRWRYVALPLVEATFVQKAGVMSNCNSCPHKHDNTNCVLIGLQSSEQLIRKQLQADYLMSMRFWPDSHSRNHFTLSLQIHLQCQWWDITVWAVNCVDQSVLGCRNDVPTQYSQTGAADWMDLPHRTMQWRHTLGIVNLKVYSTYSSWHPRLMYTLHYTTH